MFEKKARKKSPAQLYNIYKILWTDKNPLFEMNAFIYTGEDISQWHTNDALNNQISHFWNIDGIYLRFYNTTAIFQQKQYGILEKKKN